MSKWSLSGRGQGHVSNFYIVDLENFAPASRRYTGNIHNSTVVGLFMTHLRQWKPLGRVMVECTLSITHWPRLNLQVHTIDLVKTCRISSFCTVARQLARFNWHDASRGPSAIAELLVFTPCTLGGRYNTVTFPETHALQRMIAEGHVRCICVWLWVCLCVCLAAFVSSRITSTRTEAQRPTEPDTNEVQSREHRRPLAPY